MMRLKKGKWYSAFEYKGQWVGVSLNAYKSQKQLAIMNLGKVVEDCQWGRLPNGTRKKIKFIKTLKPLEERWERIRTKYIIPFFGDLTPNELTSELIAQYMESRWGRDDDGNLQAMEGTWVEEKNTLRILVLAVDENYNFHKRLIADLKYISLRKDLLPPLTREQIDLAWKHAQKTRGGADFKRAFWIMVWTGMEAKDICDLRPKHFVQIKGQEWLIKDRHKTMLKKNPTQIKIPVLPELKNLISEVPVPLDKNAPYFPHLDNDSCNKAIRKYFRKAGV